MKKLIAVLVGWTVITSTNVPVGQAHKGESDNPLCMYLPCHISRVYDESGKHVFTCIDDKKYCEDIANEHNGR